MDWRFLAVVLLLVWPLSCAKDDPPTLDPCTMDFNRDGGIGLDDAGLLGQHLGDQGGPYDVNRDGLVGTEDSDLVLLHTGHGPCP